MKNIIRKVFWSLPPVFVLTKASRMIANIFRLNKINKNARVAVVILALLVVWMISGVLSKDEVTLSSPPVKITVQYDTKIFTEKTYRPQINLSARVNSNANVFVKSLISGNIEQIFVKSGQKVKKNDWIAKISGGDSGATLKQAQSNYANAKIQLKADKELYKEKLLSKAGYQRSIASFESSKAIRNREIENHKKFYIKAPFSGEIGVIRIVKNQNIANGTIITDIADNRSFKLTAYASSAQALRLRKGHPFQGKTANNTPISGVITGISRIPESTSRTYRVEGTIIQNNLIDGQSVSVNVQLNNTKAHQIPASLLTLNTEGNLGIKTIVNNIITFTEVEILNDSLENMWVSGLPKNAYIITKGAGFAKIGSTLSE